VLIFYGMRRGEALGLRWEDIDFDAGTIWVRLQLQRIRGQLLLAPVKTRASERGLPLLDVVRQALKLQAERQDTDTDEEAGRDGLTRLHGLLDPGGSRAVATNRSHRGRFRDLGNRCFR
jgi:integrase